MASLRRIQRVSRLMSSACTLLAVLLPLLIVAIWVFWPGLLAHAIATRVSGIDTASLDAVTRAGGALISLLPVAVVVYGLSQLRALFDGYRAGRIFHRDSVVRLRRFAQSLLGHALVAPLAGAALSVWLTRLNPPGERMLAVSFGSGELAAVFLGGVFVVIAWVMSSAQELAEDSAAIV